MNWREWCWQTLAADEQLTALIPDKYIYGAGAVDVNPEQKPFVVLRFGVTTPQFQGAVSTGSVTAWAHDEPGDYARIDEVLGHVRRIWGHNHPKNPGHVTIEWSGDSTDLADDGYGTITRNATYRIVSVEGTT